MDLTGRLGIELSQASSILNVFSAQTQSLAADMKTPAHTINLSPALRRLLLDLQTWCSADCCKRNAFRISAAAISRWMDSERIDRSRELAEEIAKIESGLQRAEEQVALVAHGLGSGWGVAEFRAFWADLVVEFTSAVAGRNLADPE